MNIGLGELLVIGGVALVLVKPEELPGLARKAGIFWAQVKMNWDGMRRGWEEGVGGALDETPKKVRKRG